MVLHSCVVPEEEWPLKSKQKSLGHYTHTATGTLSLACSDVVKGCNIMRNAWDSLYEIIKLLKSHLTVMLHFNDLTLYFWMTCLDIMAVGACCVSRATSLLRECPFGATHSSDSVTELSPDKLFCSVVAPADCS